MSAMTRHMDDANLRVLVFGEEGSDEYVRVASHVEACETCQDRLDQLTGLHEIMDKAASLLKKGVKSSQGHLDSHEDEAVDPLEFLSAPSHPELLGRMGRYDVEKIIGSGGMGTVFKGYDAELNRPVAVKVLGPHLSHKGPAKQRFAREARAAAAVVHEHVVGIYDVQTSGSNPFIVMQYIHGDSLQTRIDRDGPLQAAEVLRIGMQAAAGLAAAHEQGVIHRDVKPGNILLEKGLDRALLTDFGLARTIDEASLTSSGIVAGTPHYMSPEQSGAEAVDFRTDLFSLGSVLYFMATGHPPFRAERTMGVLNRICHHPHRPVWQVNPAIPDSLAVIIDRLLEKKPAHRYSSALEAKSALAKALERLQQGKRPFWSPKIRRLRQVYGKGAMFAAMGIVTIGAILAGASAFFRNNPQTEETHREPKEPDTTPISFEQQEFVWSQAHLPFDQGAEFSKSANSLKHDLNQLITKFQSRTFSAGEDGWMSEIGQLHKTLNQIESTK